MNTLSIPSTVSGDRSDVVILNSMSDQDMKKLEKFVQNMSNKLDEKGEIRGVKVEEIIENALLPETPEGIEKRLERAEKILHMQPKSLSLPENKDIRDAIIQMHDIAKDKEMFDYAREELIEKRDEGLRISKGKLTKIQIQDLMDHGIVGSLIALSISMIALGTRIGITLKRYDAQKEKMAEMRNSLELMKKSLEQDASGGSMRIKNDIDIFLKNKYTIWSAAMGTQFTELQIQFWGINQRYNSYMIGKTLQNDTSVTIEEAYKLFGITKDCSDEELKNAYRKACKKMHPDKYEHAGKDASETAKKNFQHMQDIYDHIKKSRNIKH